MTQRRLVAIMLAEFSSQDAPKSIESSEERLSSLKPIIDNHSGRWIQDREGTSVSLFDSALDAVDAAREILELAKNELDSEIRIGIHLGDVILDGVEIHGDGVDITSRIMTSAAPGSVLISEAIYGAVKGVSHRHAQLLEEKILDDSGGTVRIYKLGSEGKTFVKGGKPWTKYVIPAILIVLAVGLGIRKFTGMGKEDTTKTILVLPFEFAESDSSNHKLVNWVLLELIRNLGNTNSLTVFNQTTAKVFRASLAPVTDARDRLDQTDYFVHGSINAEDNRITIDAMLYDREEVEIWSGEYAGHLDSLSWLTNKIALDIIATLKMKMAAKEYRRITELEPIATEQFQLRSKAWNQLSKGTPEGFATAKVYLKEIVDNNPGSSRSWAMYAEGLITMGHSSYPPPGIWKEAKEAAERALRYDSLNANAWAALAHSKTYGEQDFEGAIKAYNKANALNPNMGWNHYHYAWHLFLYDQLEEAIKEHTIAQELDPLFPGHTFWLAVLLVKHGDFERAMEEGKRLVRITNDSSGLYDISGQIYFKQGKYDSALYYAEKTKNKEGIAICKFRMGNIDPIMELIHSIKARPLNSMRAARLAGLYAEIDSLDKCFEYANYEPPIYYAPYARVMNTNPKLFRDPRFKELMAKFNLPMPKGYE